MMRMQENAQVTFFFPFCHLNSEQSLASKMAQQAKVPAAKHDGSSVVGIDSSELSFYFHMHCDAHLSAHTCKVKIS